MEKQDIAHRFEAYRALLPVNDWEQMIEAFARPLPSTCWTHPTRVSPEWIQASFSEDGHVLKPLAYAPGGFMSPRPMKWGRRFEFRAGLIHL